MGACLISPPRLAWLTQGGPKSRPVGGLVSDNATNGHVRVVLAFLFFKLLNKKRLCSSTNGAFELFIYFRGVKLKHELREVVL